MKKFIFRLERVRELKASIKEEKKRELMSAIRKVKEAEDELLKIYTALGEEAKALPQQIEYLMIDAEYRKRLKNALENQREIVRETKETLELVRASYNEAYKESEVLEKLKDKRKGEYIEWIDKETEKFLDEIAVNRSRR